MLNILLRTESLIAIVIASIAAVPTVNAAGSAGQIPAIRKIDALIAENYKKHNITPNTEISDEVFLRRIYLDVIGRIPSLAEAEAFNDSTASDKRARLIERLLNSEGFVSHSYNFWADVLRINSGLGGGARDAESAYRLWVKSSLRENKPYDQFVKEMVSARGHLWDNGAIGYYQRDRGMPLDNMSNTIRIFLGTRLECAQCHNHPFDKWTQMDYFKMAAFSYNVEANRYKTENSGAVSKLASQLLKEKQKKLIESKYAHLDKREAQRKAKQELGKGEKNEAYFMRKVSRDLYNPIKYISVGENTRKLQLPHDYQYDDAKPKEKVIAGSMFGSEIEFGIGDNKIDAYASWMTSKDNPTFTRVIANRLWKKVFGVGIAAAVDDLTEQTVISNPELLAYLEDLMRNSNYDMKKFLQALYNTKTYQRAANSEEIIAGMPYYYPGPALRRMSAEQAWDSLIVMLIDDPDHYQPKLKTDLNSIEKAKQIFASLEERDTDDFLAMVTEAAKLTKGISVREEKIREEYMKAREEEDTQKIKSLSGELKKLKGGINKKIAEIAYNKVSKGNDQQLVMANLGMTSSAMDSVKTKLPATKRSKGKFKDNKKEYRKVMNDPALSKEDKRAYEAKIKAEKKNYAAESSKLKSDNSNWSRATKQMARASELESPARRGHFLREFGQSDREVIENANGSASVPQALNLLNGPTAEMLRNANSVMGQEVEKAKTPEEKINTIYMAMLTRKPSAPEMKSLLAEVEVNGEKGYDNIVWALLNTQQFIFVQ